MEPEKTTKVGDENLKPENTTEPNKLDEVNNSSIDERVKQLESTNKRLLEESQSYKKNWQTLKTEKESEENKVQEAQGHYKELYEKQIKKNDKLFKKNMARTIDATLRPKAQEMGAKDLNALMKLGNTKFLNYDESDDKVEGTEVFLNDLKERMPWFFEKKEGKPSINSTIPGGMKKTITGETNVKPITAKAKLENILAANYKK